MIIEYLNRIQKLFSSHILLYHSTFSNIPEDIKDGLHNVHPEILYKQISWYKNFFDIVKVDDLFEQSSDQCGKVSITFDDGYQSVLKEGIPVIKSLNVPCTIFINGCTMNNFMFWRDKIRFLINNDLIEDFLNYNRKEQDINFLTKLNFYKKTKSPELNSKFIEKLCDNYLKNKFGESYLKNYCVESIKDLLNDPLISYGNHSYHHYVLSSLSMDEQEYEIKRNHMILKDIPNRSNIFSIPFGGPKDFNNDTLKIIKKYGYKGILYSQDKINLFSRYNQYTKELPGLERFMVKNSINQLHKFLPKLFFRSVFR